MNIDPTTGLPALPEGYFWEVAQHMEEVRAGNSYGGYSDPWKVKAGYSLHIRYVHRKATARKKHWWSKDLVTHEAITLSAGSKRLIDPVKQAAAEAEYMACGVWDLHLDYFSTVHYEHITPEIVKAAAIELYTEWQDELEAKRVAKDKREASEALLGVYPPKALP